MAHLEATARLLGVPELALRMTIDPISPHPTLDVVTAVVRVCGVDPGWLISGEYEPMTHRAVTNEGSLTTDELTTMIARRLTPVDSGAQDGGQSEDSRREA